MENVFVAIVYIAAIAGLLAVAAFIADKLEARRPRIRVWRVK